MPIPLSQVAYLESGAAPSNIRHRDLIREIRINANTQGRSLVEVVAELQAGLTNDTLNMMSMIGVILLMGLVTKNAILLVDFANVQRREGTPRFDAIVNASKVRLRPTS